MVTDVNVANSDGSEFDLLGSKVTLKVAVGDADSLQLLKVRSQTKARARWLLEDAQALLCMILLAIAAVAVAAAAVIAFVLQLLLGLIVIAMDCACDRDVHHTHMLAEYHRW
jgi:hypothetical protein